MRKEQTIPVHALVALTIGLLSGTAGAQNTPRAESDHFASPCIWKPRATAPIDRLEAHAVVLRDKLFIFGGFKNGSLHATARVDVYDPVADVWSTRASMPEALTHSTIAADGDDVWLAGGFLGDHPGPVVASVWRYDALVDSWTAGPSLPATRGSAGMVRLGRKLHFFGGVSDDKDIPLGDHWTLDLDTLSGWVPAPDLPVPRNHLGAVALEGRALAIGGQDGHSHNPHDLNWVHAFDPLANAWVQLASLPFGRSHFEPGTFALNGRVAIVGGRATPLGTTTLTNVTVYDSATDAWTEQAPLPTSLIAPTANLINGELIVTGGGTGSTVPTDTSLARPWWFTLDDGAVRINAGGTSYTGAAGKSWCMDQAATSGAAAGNPQIADISGTVNDELYRSSRSGANSDTDHFEYHIPVRPGLFRVRLHFAETWWGATGGGNGGVGKRVFSVWLEDQLILSNYDIYADVGSMAAVRKVFDVDAADGEIDLVFHSSVDRPVVSAIEIIPLAGDAFEAYCTALPNSTGLAAELTFQGSTSLAANELTLIASDCPPNQLGFHLLATQRAQVPLGDGFLCVSGQVFRIVPANSTDASGTAARQLNLASPPDPAAALLPGSTWNFQYFYRDASAASFNYSNGLSLRFTH